MAIAAALKSVGLDDADWDKAAAGLSLAALATHTAGAQVRGGVIPATGDPLKVVAGSGLSVTVKAGPYLLPTSDPSRGPIIVTLPADTTVTSETANGSNPRIDRVILEVSDDGDVTETTLAASASIGATSLSLTAPGVDEPALHTGFYVVGSETVQVTALSGSGPYTATLGAALTSAHASGDPISEAPFRVRIVKGVAAGSPVVPSTNWITPGGSSLSLGNGAWAPLGYVAIGTNATSVGAITDERVWTAAAGGMVRVASVAALTAAALPKGTPVFIEDSATEAVTTSDAGAYELTPKSSVIGSRTWHATQTVPANADPYGLTWTSAVVTAGNYGTAPATGGVNTLTIAATGLYDIEVSATASPAAATAVIILTTPRQTNRADQVGGSKYMQMTLLGVPLTAGYVLGPAVWHQDASSVSFDVYVTIVRRA